MLFTVSYTEQLYIGLADILLSKHISDDVEIQGADHRIKVLSTAQLEMKKRVREEEERNSTFSFVQYGEQYYGNEKLSKAYQ